MPLRKVSRCHQDLVTIVFEVAAKLNLKDIEYITEFGTEDIDIYASGIYQVTIKGFREGQKVKFDTIIKWHADPAKRALFRELYSREKIFYQRIVPELLGIQQKFKLVEGLKIKFQNCVLANCEYGKETVVLLKDNEFNWVIKRFQETKWEHAVLVMKTLAKLHGLSFALQKLNPRMFEDLKRLCGKDVQYSEPEFVSKSIECFFSNSVSVVSDPVAKKKLKAFAPQIRLVLSKCTTVQPHSVFCHGDCWNNNILFKYRGRPPLEALFIDFQLWRLASPATDISYYFYMVTDDDFRSKHYERLINVYFGTLSAVLRQCNLDVCEVYPRYIFEKHLNQFSVLGLIEALVSMKIITAPPENALKMTEMKYCTENGLMEDLSINQCLYVRRVNGVVSDFFERKFSSDDILNT